MSSVPYIVQGEKTYLRSDPRCEEVATLLEHAWTGLRIIRCQIGMDCRDPESYGGDTQHNMVDCWLSVSGSAEALIGAGLIVESDLPAHGRASRNACCWRLARRKRGYNLVVMFGDDYEGSKYRRAHDAVATALWRGVWQPVRREAA